jgi:hypothetical protein
VSSTITRGGERMKKRILALLVLAILSMFVIRVNAIIEDMNEDGIVDINDLYEVAKSFGSEPGHPRWNANADFNEDGLVDLQDIYWIASNFGKTG